MENVKKTREIQIGSVRLGGDSPLVIQSMTNTDTNDIDATVSQCIRIFERGADMVRITTQSRREIESLAKIKEKLREKGFTRPLVADVHFLPAVAEEAAKIVEKVRINPGNYLPTKYRGPDKFDPEEQKKQIGRIRERLIPLINICKKHGTAIRIGVNHGSLSERILNWYGDTPEGMVESAIEFLSVFKEENFHRIVVSLKASSGRVMVQANRLMVKRMQEEDLIYPLHLGVTEAGDEEEGRIKSAVGICSLLAEGIGDTIRVSLTEAPEEEIPVAHVMKDIFGRKGKKSFFADPENSFYDPFHFNKRKSIAVDKVGGENVPVVINTHPFSGGEDDAMTSLGYLWEKGILEMKTTASDFVYIPDNVREYDDIKGMQLIQQESHPEKARNAAYYLLKDSEDLEPGRYEDQVIFVKINRDTDRKSIKNLKNASNIILVFDPGEDKVITSYRQFFQFLETEDIRMPVILYRKYSSKDREELMIRASGELGPLFIDGFGDGLWLEDLNTETTVQDLREISFGILQACGSRISKTEYIACPSCGRTLFDIQSTLKKVKAATAEFTGLKIAVMGCIVNGPGEMADADFGYVGAGRGKVTLYRAREAVKRNVPEERAVEELLGLIRRTIDPQGFKP